MNKGEKIEGEMRPEAPASPEMSPEMRTASPEKQSSDVGSEEKVQAAGTEAQPKSERAPTQRLQPAASKDQILQAVERELERGLLDTYMAMDTAQRKDFRESGESLAQDLRTAGQAGARPSEMHEKVMGWLRKVPNASEFWLEQAGYIKTTKVIRSLRENA